MSFVLEMNAARISMRAGLPGTGTSIEEAFGNLLQFVSKKVEPAGWKYPGSKFGE
jgi:hypothetical protein